MPLGPSVWCVADGRAGILNQTKALAAALDTLETDDAARLLSFLTQEKRLPVLAAMSAKDAAAARGLLTYEAGTAGRPMTAMFVRVKPEWTGNDPLEHLKNGLL